MGYMTQDPPAAGLQGADMLCAADREMMQEFSRLCLQRLNGHLSLRLFLSLLRHFVEANVEKEIEKDRLVLTHAAAEFGRGAARGDVDIHGLFEMTKQVDHEFISRLSTPLFAMAIRHEDIEPVRKERITALVGMSYDLLAAWNQPEPFHCVVRNTFTEPDFRDILGNVLRLYALETKMLGNSITLHGPAGTAKDLLAGKLFSTMEKTASEVAVLYARKVFASAG